MTSSSVKPATGLLAKDVKALGPALTRASIARMRELAWFEDLSASQRADVAVVLDHGIANLADWLNDPEQTTPRVVFAAASADLARAITLRQTLQLVRLAVDVVSAELSTGNADGIGVRESLLTYGREVAFAAAEAYASIAEEQASFTARIEASLVAEVAQGQLSPQGVAHASVLGWRPGDRPVVALASDCAGRDVARRPLLRLADAADLDVLTATLDDVVVILVGGDPAVIERHVELIAGVLPDGSVTVGPVVVGLREAHESVQEAVAALRAASLWRAAPRVVRANELLVERIVQGDDSARRRLTTTVTDVLSHQSPTLIQTLQAYFDTGRSIEGAARQEYLHPNTVRYRLRKVRDLVGLNPLEPRDATTLHIAVMLAGRTSDAEQVPG